MPKTHILIGMILTYCAALYVQCPGDLFTLIPLVCPRKRVKLCRSPVNEATSFYEGNNYLVKATLYGLIVCPSWYTGVCLIILVDSMKESRGGGAPYARPEGLGLVGLG